MKKRRCRCGKYFKPVESELGNLYVKKKPCGEFKEHKVAYCPKCNYAIRIRAIN